MAKIGPPPRAPVLKGSKGVLYYPHPLCASASVSIVDTLTGILLFILCGGIDCKRRQNNKINKEKENKAMLSSVMYL